MYLFHIVLTKGIGIKMIKQLKCYFAFVFIFTLCVGCFFPTYAYAKIQNNDKIIGMVRSDIPYIQVEIKDESIASEDITGRIGSNDMQFCSITPISKKKMLTYIIIDNSYSMTQSNICPVGSFDALKSALSDLVKRETDYNNNFAVYSVGEGNAKLLGTSIDDNTANDTVDKISELTGKEDATNLNEALNMIFNQSFENRDDYQVIKFLLVTDSSADYSTGIDMTEVENKYQYNKIPLYTICNTISENSNAFKQLRTLSRNSGGEGIVFNYSNDKYADKTINSIYKDMTNGVIACFITDTAKDNNTKELIINVKGTDYSETVLLDTAANIDENITASVEVNESNNAFVIRFTQEGFSGNLPLNGEAVNNNSYIINKSGKDKPLPVSRVEKNSDGSYSVYMGEDIYSGKYDFSFNGITDLSQNANGVEPLKNCELKAKSTFWIAFPYLIALLALIIVFLAFYLILLNLKKKKNVKTIKELFVTQVSETVEERHYIQNIKENTGIKVNMYFQTSKYPQKHISVNIKSSIIVGRSDICDVYIDDSKMSRQHFAVEYTQGVFMITDLQSANGTYVNGVKVHSRQRLNSGDMIVAGLTSVRIEF